MSNLKKIFATFALLTTLITPTLTAALVPPPKASSYGLNVLINSGDSQTQAMAMVLSIMALKKHNKPVSIVLCGAAGDLADKNIEGIPVKRPNGKAPSAKDQLKFLISNGAKVQVCPLYLPNADKDISVLLDGITVATPQDVAQRILNLDYKNISF